MKASFIFLAMIYSAAAYSAEKPPKDLMTSFPGMSCEEMQNIRELHTNRLNFEIGYSNGVRSIVGPNDPRYKESQAKTAIVSKEVDQMRAEYKKKCAQDKK
jgi:hypothetical protein